MRVLHIHQRLIGIAKAAREGDAEMAHSLENRLFVDVLTEIARAENDQGQLAREALRSRELKFQRYTA